MMIQGKALRDLLSTLGMGTQWHLLRVYGAALRLRRWAQVVARADGAVRCLLPAAGGDRWLIVVRRRGEGWVVLCSSATMDARHFSDLGTAWRFAHAQATGDDSALTEADWDNDEVFQDGT